MRRKVWRTDQLQQETEPPQSQWREAEPDAEAEENIKWSERWVGDYYKKRPAALACHLIMNLTAVGSSKLTSQLMDPLTSPFSLCFKKFPHLHSTSLQAYLKSLPSDWSERDTNVAEYYLLSGKSILMFVWNFTSIIIVPSEICERKGSGGTCGRLPREGWEELHEIDGCTTQLMNNPGVKTFDSISQEDERLNLIHWPPSKSRSTGTFLPTNSVLNFSSYVKKYLILRERHN